MGRWCMVTCISLIWVFIHIFHLESKCCCGGGSGSVVVIVVGGSDVRGIIIRAINFIYLCLQPHPLPKK